MHLKTQHLDLKWCQAAVLAPQKFPPHLPYPHPRMPTPPCAPVSNAHEAIRTEPQLSEVNAFIQMRAERGETGRLGVFGAQQNVASFSPSPGYSFCFSLVSGSVDPGS
jgi:hypothetical protein